MRTKLKLFILAIAATFPMAVVADAGFDDTNDQSQTDKTLAVKNVSYENEYSFMYKDFEVVAPDDGDYYMEFWLIPAEYPDGAYTTFSVFVNDTKVGEITPKTANWQACRVNGNEKVSLYKGINKISIGTLLPEVPNVESVSLAAKDSDARISRLAYDQYLSMADNYASDNDAYAVTNTSTQIVNNATSVAFPLKYSFYSVIQRNAGEKITVKTMSATAHKVDVMYCGATGFTSTTGVPINASSEIMQGLSWLGIAEKRSATSHLSTNMEIDAPLTGNYLIRLRSVSTSSSYLCNVNINDTYQYNSVPMSFTWWNQSIPADGKEYITITQCSQQNKADPFLFIHGNAADRVVGFNDDVPKELLKSSGIKFTKESCLSQTYKINTTGMSLMNTSSQTPGAYINICKIITKLKGATLSNVAERPKQVGNSLVTSEFGVDEDIVASAETVTESTRKMISIYDMAGRFINSFDINAEQGGKYDQNMGISSPGVYILKIESEKGIECKKIMVR